MPRKGFLTPSTFADLMTSAKGKSDELGKTALKVVDKLVLDMLGVETDEDSQGTPTSCQWGLDNEWFAIQTYSERTFTEVHCPVEFRASRTHPYVGGTMDGLVGNKGGIETKCPYSSLEHLGNLLEAAQLKQYKYQIQGYLWIFELDWIDFISVDPRFPQPYDLAVYRVYPQQDIVEAIQKRCGLAYQMAMSKLKMIKESV
jgi:hypothetical protein